MMAALLATAAPPAEAIPSREATQAKLDRRSAVASKYRASSTFTLGDLLEARAREHAGRPLLHCGDRTWTYAEVNAEANRVAHAARAQGVGRGDGVALAMENRQQFFFAWFGLAKLGAIVAFLNTHIGGRALAHALASTGARRAIVGEECLAAFEAPEVDRGATSLWRGLDQMSSVIGNRAAFAQAMTDGFICVRPGRPERQDRD